MSETIKIAAETIISMCTDYLKGGTTEKGFSDILSVYSKQIKEKLCEACIHYQGASLSDTSCSGCVDHNRFKARG